jgi:hypothetical protein
LNALGVLALAFEDGQLGLVRDTGAGMQFEWAGQILNTIASAPNSPQVVVTLNHVWFVNGAEIWVYERTTNTQVAYIDDTSSFYATACAAGPDAIFVSSDYLNALYEIDNLTMTSSEADATWSNIVPAFNIGVASVVCRDRIVLCYDTAGLALLELTTGNTIGPVPSPFGGGFLPGSLCSDGRYFYLACTDLPATQTFIQKFSPYSDDATLGTLTFPGVIDTNLTCDGRQLYFGSLGDIQVVDSATMGNFAAMAGPIDNVTHLSGWAGVGLAIGRGNAVSYPSWAVLSTGRDVVNVRINGDTDTMPPLYRPSYELI